MHYVCVYDKSKKKIWHFWQEDVPFNLLGLYYNIFWSPVASTVYHVYLVCDYSTD